MTTEYKPPLADSLFMEDKSKLITNPSWLLWLSKIASLASGINNATALTIAAGDLLIGSDVNVLSALAKGTANHKLFMNAGATSSEWASGVHTGTFTRAMDAANGDVAYTGLGFKPSSLIILTNYTNKSQSIGFAANTSYVIMVYGASPGYISSTSYCIWITEDTGQDQQAVNKTFDSDGFTLTWTKIGSPTSANATCFYIAFR